ncbi:MAG: hypothetical protein ABL856_01590 [Gallionella sp.]
MQIQNSDFSGCTGRSAVTDFVNFRPEFYYEDSGSLDAPVSLSSGGALFVQSEFGNCILFSRFEYSRISFN